MVIAFPEERLPEICCIQRKLQALEGVKIYMEPQQIRYPGSFLDILQRKDMVEGKEVVLTAREFDILALMARHSGRRHTYAKERLDEIGESPVMRKLWNTY